MAKRQNHFISGKPFQKGQMATMEEIISPPDLCFMRRI